MRSNKNMFWSILVFILLCLISGITCANNRFFEQRYKGWLWFEEKREVPKKSEEADQPLNLLNEMKKAKEENERFKEELELAKHLMIRYPDNLEYIKYYKLKEKEMLDRALLLSQSFVMVNFLNPDIADELKTPQNMYGRKLKQVQEEQDKEKAIKEVSKQVELFVFIQANCIYCDTLEKHLSTFAKRYGFSVEAVTADGSVSKYFKTNKSAELVKSLGLQVMPMVLAVTNDSSQRFELARGAVSIADLEGKSFLLFKYLNGQK